MIRDRIVVVIQDRKPSEKLQLDSTLTLKRPPSTRLKLRRNSSPSSEKIEQRKTPLSKPFAVVPSQICDVLQVTHDNHDVLQVTHHNPVHGVVRSQPMSGGGARLVVFHAIAVENMVISSLSAVPLHEQARYTLNLPTKRRS